MPLPSVAITMKMIVAIVICALSILSAQGLALNEDPSELNLKMVHLKEHSEFLSNMQQSLNSMSLNLNEELAIANNTLYELPNTLREEGKGKIIMLYVEALQQVEALVAPQKCITAGQQDLLKLRQDNLESFSKCSNLTNALKDVAKMVIQVGKLAAEILVTSDEILNGFGRCTTWNPFKFLHCTYEWIKDSVTDVFDTVKAFGEFNKNMGALLTDLKAQFNDCFHKSKAQAILDQLQVIKSINECSA